MILLLALACSGTNGVKGLSATDYLPPWPEHLVFRSVNPDSFSESIDTASEVEEVLHMTITGADPDWTLSILSGENLATATLVQTLSLSSADGLAITGADDQTYSTPVVLLESRFEFDTPVSSGGWTTTATYEENLVTWYGSFHDLVDVKVEGDVTGEFRFDTDLGPVQWAWGDLAGDLAWYE